MSRAVRNLPLLVLLLVSAWALTGFGCRRSASIGTSDGNALVVWGLWQESTMMQPVLDAFEKQSGIKVEYRKVGSVATYEKMLLAALAEGRGPDVFAIHHTWVDGKRGLMSPAPADVIDERRVREEFVSVVADDLVRDGFVYALPTSVDTMALYYNEDALSAAGVARPPHTWEEFQRDVEKITKVSRLGNIEQSAAAIGTAANVNRASDILQLLMLQSGMSLNPEPSGVIKLAGEIGERSLIFYTDFSNKSKKVFTWDLSQDFSIDAFAEGETAMMFNYSYHIPTIQAKNPRLRFGIASVPQIGDDSTPVTFASYWPFAVSPSSNSARAAWQFVRLVTSAPMAQLINEAQVAPPARRDSIVALQSDPEMGVFADQSLLAATWPRLDIVAADAIFNAMIDDVVTGAIAVPDALRRAEDQLKQLITDDKI